MKDAESPRTIFTALYTRCQEAPQRLSYDNGCNTHQYLLNREPGFFANTSFLIDETHYQVSWSMLHHVLTRVAAVADRGAAWGSRVQQSVADSS
jgi:hypothetical protein